jgi:hypothetical protein
MVNGINITRKHTVVAAIVAHHGRPVVVCKDVIMDSKYSVGEKDMFLLCTDIMDGYIFNNPVETPSAETPWLIPIALFVEVEIIPTIPVCKCPHPTTGALHGPRTFALRLKDVNGRCTVESAFDNPRHFLNANDIF